MLDEQVLGIAQRATSWTYSSLVRRWPSGESGLGAQPVQLGLELEHLVDAGEVQSGVEELADPDEPAYVVLAVAAGCCAPQDPFRELDRLAQQLLGADGTTNRPAVMPMDAWREGDVFVLEFDLPGIAKESIDLDVERNVLTVRAERVAGNGDWEMLATERPRGLFSRQLVLGDNLDLEHIEAAYADGVLRLRVPVAEKAKPRKIEIQMGSSDSEKAITA